MSAKHTPGKSIAEVLGLRPREAAVINDAIFSRTHYGILDFLPAQDKGTQNAARRMIERGFLSKGRAKLVPASDWIVVRFTEKNRKAINAAISKATDAA